MINEGLANIKKKYFFAEIERLRGFACIMVLINHISVITPLKFVSEWASKYFSNGSYAVCIFFTISGFLITQFLRKSFVDCSGGDYLEVLSKHFAVLKTFWVRRFFRLFPVIFASLLLLIVFMFLFNNYSWLYEILRIPLELICGIYNLSVINFVGSEYVHFCYGGTGLLWTINIEIYFYILWPIMFIVLRNDSRRILFLCALGLGSMFIARPIIFDYANKNACYYHTLSNLGSISMGCILAFFYNELAPSFKKCGLFTKAMWFCLLILCWVYPRLYIERVWYYQIPLVAFSSVIVWMCVNNYNIFDIPILKNILEFLGKRSYSFYVFQMILSNFVLCLTANGIFNEPHDTALFYELQFIIYIITLLVVTEISYRFIEIPTRKILINKI